MSKKVSLILGACAALLLQSAGARAQVPHNRSVEKVALWPSPTADGVEVIVVWNFDVAPASVPRDLTTDIALDVNGTRTGSIREALQVNPGSGIGCEGGPPCSGSCGSGSLNGGAFALLCYKDGECTPQFCDCDCGAWIVSRFPAETLQPGDEITVILYPAPGALPDDDTSDDRMTTHYRGRPSGWNRGVELVGVVPVGPGLYDVQVVGSVGWETQPGYANLDLQVEMRRNGSTVGMQAEPAELENIFDQTCFQNGCGWSCGTYNGIERHCDPYLWWDCACHAGWLSIFPGVQLQPGDEIAIILYPAPGAIPELPETSGDDQLTVLCCTPSSVRDGAAGPVVRLEQNRPNPFRHPTSIGFELPRAETVSLEIFDVAGREVRGLLERPLPAGRWTAIWDGTTDEGVAAPAGLYYYRLSWSGGSETRKMAYAP